MIHSLNSTLGRKLWACLTARPWVTRELAGIIKSRRQDGECQFSSRPSLHIGLHLHFTPSLLCRFFISISLPIPRSKALDIRRIHNGHLMSSKVGYQVKIRPVGETVSTRMLPHTIYRVCTSSCFLPRIFTWITIRNMSLGKQPNTSFGCHP